MKKLFTTLILAFTTTTVFASPYVIKQDETLLGIANRHEVTYSQLMKANKGLDPNYIKAGFKIEIPASTKKKISTKSYVHPASKRVTSKVTTPIKITSADKAKSIMRDNKDLNYASQFVTPSGNTKITVVEYNEKY